MTGVDLWRIGPKLFGTISQMSYKMRFRPPIGLSSNRSMFTRKKTDDMPQQQSINVYDEVDRRQSQQQSINVYDEVDRKVLQKADVVGLTTTGLAKRIQVLRHITSKVVICEEAGEVMEPHMLWARRKKRIFD